MKGADRPPRISRFRIWGWIHVIKKLFETHVTVADLERSMAFYGGLLNLELGMLESGRRIAFYWLGGRNQTMLGVWETPADAVRPRHLAFEVALESVAAAVTHLHEHGITTRNFYGEESSMPSVFGWMPAASIYFSDPDGNELEFIAPLDEPADPDFGVASLAEWQARRGR